VWLRLLSEGVFDCFDTIIKSGDKGGALKNVATFWLAGRIWELYQKRLLWHLLCPYHAWNRCDPHGGRITRICAAKERDLDRALGTPEAHADAINARQLKNTATARSYHVVRRHDENLPANLALKEDQVYSVRDVCVAYFETPDLFDEDPVVTRTICRTVLGLGSLHANSEDVAFIDVRPDSRSDEKICRACTAKYGRTVLLEEHDQSHYYLCPETQTFRMENERSLFRKCNDCNDLVGKRHIQGKKRPCPSLASKHGWIPGSHCHKQVWLQTLMGRKLLTLAYTRTQRIIDLLPQPRPFRSCTKKELTDLLVPGMNIIYKKLTSAQDDLPWGLGECLHVDFLKKLYTLRLYERKIPTTMRTQFTHAWKTSPLGKWIKTDNQLVIPWSTPKILPKLYFNSIATETLHEIMDDNRFNWKGWGRIFVSKLLEIQDLPPQQVTVS